MPAPEDQGGLLIHADTGKTSQGAQVTYLGLVNLVPKGGICAIGGDTLTFLPSCAVKIAVEVVATPPVLELLGSQTGIGTNTVIARKT